MIRAPQTNLHILIPGLKTGAIYIQLIKSSLFDIRRMCNFKILIVKTIPNPSLKSRRSSPSQRVIQRRGVLGARNRCVIAFKYGFINRNRRHCIKFDVLSRFAG